MASLFKGKRLLRTNGEAILDTDAILDGKVIGVYFSASWCPPCRQFTPVLANLYQEIKDKKYPFEVVFVSVNEDSEQLKQYLIEDHGDWLHLPFTSPFTNELTELFHIQAIPKLIILKPSGEVITTLGRKMIQEKGSVCIRSWLEAAETTTTRYEDKKKDAMVE
ncbi:nucleoredoxin-like protein 2 [Antedon mediterranea]|uniref:nucleoredoxin-like protein 2 n=1 Tax=Antedon mediterranea TaxID=105859 RepID=UPI003AF65AD3